MIYMALPLEMISRVQDLLLHYLGDANLLSTFPKYVPQLEKGLLFNNSLAIGSLVFFIAWKAGPLISLLENLLVIREAISVISRVFNNSVTIRMPIQFGFRNVATMTRAPESLAEREYFCFYQLQLMYEGEVPSVRIPNGMTYVFS